MRVRLEKNVGTGVTKALLHCLDRNQLLHHLGRSAMPEETPGDMRRAELVCDRLEAPLEECLVPDWAGLHGFALLSAVWKHPTFFLRPLVPSTEAFDVCLSQPNRAVRAMVLWGVNLPLIDGTHHPQVPGLRDRIFPFEGHLVRSNGSHRDQIDQRADRLLESVDQVDHFDRLWGVFSVL
jgi:hypothetical protein